jgi:hypothetical protein
MPVVLAIASFPALLFLFGLNLGDGRDLLRTPLGMMHRAAWLGAYFSQFALIDAFADDCFCGVFGGLELRSPRALTVDYKDVSTSNCRMLCSNPPRG